MTSCCSTVALSFLRSTMNATTADLTATSTPVALAMCSATLCSRWMSTPRSLRFAVNQRKLERHYGYLVRVPDQSCFRLGADFITWNSSEYGGCLCNLPCLGVALSRLVPVWACLCCFAQSDWGRRWSGFVSHHHTQRSELKTATTTTTTPKQSTREAEDRININCVNITHT